ncbi:hypothetical protein ACIRL2_01475 [Embleya sp. NPDC127516]|uniref:hypothetical protein n=1 Tax=Embleya sp. NPDC127516 TaxID=3363990 RepID=UPI0038137098
MTVSLWRDFTPPASEAVSAPAPEPVPTPEPTEPPAPASVPEPEPTDVLVRPYVMVVVEERARQQAEEDEHWARINEQIEREAAERAQREAAYAREAAVQQARRDAAEAARAGWDLEYPITTPGVAYA